MKYKAVIFDLFGTLVDIFSLSEYEDVLGSLAAALGATSGDFKRVWYETSHERNIGIFQTSPASIRFICEKLGITADDEKVKLATTIRREYLTRAMKPRRDALEVLSRLRSNGMKTGLVSNCSPITVEVWPETPFPPLFDVTVFSCSAGVRKPDPAIYNIATEKLAVMPENCLYVGDGDSNELTGAEAVGLNPVMIHLDYEGEPNYYIADRQEWDGPVISSLTEVLNLVK